MSEASKRLDGLSESKIMLAFPPALVALVPTMRELDILEDDAQPYDDFDALAEGLWIVLVARSLAWKHGLDAPPQLPRYGFAEQGSGNGHIEARWPTGCGRFIQFIGDRTLGGAPFNAVDVLLPDGRRSHIAVEAEVAFHWVQSRAGRLG